MSDAIQSLAQQVGISPDLAAKGVGAVLAYVKEHLGDDALNHVQGLLPNAGDLIESFTKAHSEAGSGGFMGMVTELAGKLIGGQLGDITKLGGVLSGLGFSIEQLEAFLPKIIAMLHDVFPADLLGNLSKIGLGLNEDKNG